jgi:hypothetical protein
MMLRSRMSCMSTAHLCCLTKVYVALAQLTDTSILTRQISSSITEPRIVMCEWSADSPDICVADGAESEGLTFFRGHLSALIGAIGGSFGFDMRKSPLELHLGRHWQRHPSLLACI